MYESSVLGQTGVSYRYIRFRVTATNSTQTDGGGKVFFFISEFGMSKATELRTEYVHNTGSLNRNDRGLQSFTLTDGENSLSVSGIQTSSTSPVYVDKSSSKLTTTAGATLSFSDFTYTGSWMHAYAYVDYNKDFYFESTNNNGGTTDGEIVSYNYYNDKTITGDAGSRADAMTSEHNGSKTLPAFTLPANLAPGEYRMRIKVDWNNIDADYGASDIATNGGCQCDITLVVEQPVEPEVPSSGITSGYYRIQNRYMDLDESNPRQESGKGAYLSNASATSSAPILCSSTLLTDAGCIWYIEGDDENGFTFKNMNNGKYISKSATSLDNPHVQFVDNVDNAGKFKLMKESSDQYFYIMNPDANKPYFNAANQGLQYIYEDAKDDGPAHWTIEKATTLDVTINPSAGYGTIYLPFDVTLPSGLVAYPVTSTNKSYVSLTQGKSDIPANNGAILAGSGNYTLNIENATSDWTGNKLQGSNINTYVQGSAYVLGLVSDNVGLYLAELNKNATGGSGNTHFLNNANKAYLPATAVPQASQVQALFFNVDETTGVEEVEVESTVKTIYDLSGRKVSGMSAPGLYIVNGKKVLVK